MSISQPIVELLIFLASMLALGVAGYQTFSVFRESDGTDRMREISKAIREGAEAFLAREYKTVAMVGAVLTVLIAIGLYSTSDYAFSLHLALGFVVGVLGSALAGYVGMYVSVRANVRTAAVARGGKLDPAMRFAFKGGSVTGLCVAGFALLGLVVFYVGFQGNVLEMVGFIFGASLMSLFARVGGGIYTKGADVGADLVGKVEAGIPEDDPRNPAVIADNVGDNVGDCAGMAADLFETYVVTAVSTMLLAYLFTQNDPAGFGATLPNAILFPLIISAWSIVATLIAFPFVRMSEGGSIMGALYKGLYVTVIIGIIGLGVLSYIFMPATIWIGVFIASAVGLVVMIVIVFSTDYYTGTGRRPVTSISEAAQRGAGPVVIEGMSVGLEAVLIPALAIVAGIITSYSIMYVAAPTGVNATDFGLYGIGLAAASMLSVTGMIISIDAFGPITDNAGGIAEMAELPPEAREVTDPLDAVGNTTKAVTKGYAVGSAALAALVLFAAYYQAVPAADAFQLSALAVNQPLVIVGLVIGAMLPFFFTAFLMRAVGTAAQAIVEEVRRQFRTVKGIMDGTARPEYGPCVDIVTKTAIHELTVPALIAVVTPLAVGFLLGPVAVSGLLFGVILSGLPLAIFMTVGGGAWDNGKKYIESGHFGGKGSDAHKAAVVGDTVGDATKDTAGPAINPLIKVVNTISILFVTLVASHNLFMWLSGLGLHL
jgi:K(+)-stimulated pyrophosphate-energized sodium pump